jgi:50S ribosomal subunit-associated GTPase HflX
MDYPPYSQFYPEYPQAMGTWESYYESPMTTGEGEKEWLKSQAELIRQQIDQIKNRISQMEKE